MTVVIVVTMVFAPAFKHNHWVYRLVGKRQTSHVVRCTTAKRTTACPWRRQIVRRVYRPLPKNALARCKGHTPCLPRKILPRTHPPAKRTPAVKTVR